MKTLSSLSLLLLCFVSTSRGAEILVDFDAKYGTISVQTGQAVLGLTDSDVWNAVGTGADSALVDSANDSVGITYATTAGSTFGNGGGTAFDSATQDLMIDYLDQANIGFAVTLGNMSAYAGDTFTLVLYGAGDTAGQGDAFSLATGATGGNTGTTLDTTGESREISAGEGVAYQTFTGTLTGDDLAIAIAENGSSYSSLNGFQLEIETVPEPGTWAMLLSGFVGLGAILRRRSHA